MEGVLILGGTGMIGSKLSIDLTNQGYDVKILSTKPSTAENVFYYNYKTESVDMKAFDNVQHIIHLAGANIGEKRWFRKRKQEIVESRVKPILFIKKVLSRENITLKTFISASAVGFYGSNESKSSWFSEYSPSGSDFLSNVCVAWENAANSMSENAERIVILRTGIVLSEKGGVYTKLYKFVSLGLGTVIGSGNQYMPWIHIDDLSRLYLTVLEQPDMLGVYNAVAPDVIDNSEFMHVFAKSLNRGVFPIYVPKILLKVVIGRRSILLTKGVHCVSNRLQKSDFKFLYPNLKDAILNISKRESK
ncbi:MAG: TIGR01777 family protein [Bacteroidales bacterium]|nr:TIGR01777 family protein [Bacteroidales bacterium]